MASGVPITVQVGSTSLQIETTALAGTQATSRLSDASRQTSDAFARAQQAIVDIAASTVEIIEQAQRRAVRPDTVEVEFGLKFSAGGSLLMASASGEATLQVRLTYTGRSGSSADGTPAP
ncbi:CU044_2847 family protein [Streptomyces sp. 21So2-11]|uniref:CU044_2847 family protein n=1 Tax=Streptomyces sp. 21So2-11 TaxID=3144408 RepID=UPI00321A8860